ncbi:hypothetical protein F9288_08895 [Sphingomonas sp. CL5.1]|uniref:hypothetical protein n=1 Tax=Sphingomonas sp. CL5.1 TaxID=2653203 RepID=UPI001582EC40|nr:hypothetical protein [Sphingomonas sp. CL5.1]QKR99743.1 hypothetical protein F9288_08895 [Sphingomonas sp. CL5.1]
MFNLFYAASCVYALVRGGAPERIGAAILVADFELSLLVVKPIASRFTGVEWTMFAVDLGAFGALYALSLFTTRYWPAWMAAFQGCVALSHIAGFRGEIAPWVYGTVVAAWAYAMLAILAAATWRHQRRLLRYSIDPAWVWHLPESYRSGAPVEELTLVVRPPFLARRLVRSVLMVRALVGR